MTFNCAMILGGDVGGTKVNLGLFSHEGARVKLLLENSFPSRKYSRLQDIVKEFLAANGAPSIQRACLGIAGPVRNGVVNVTNLPWKIEAAELVDELGIPVVALINDLEANAYGLAELDTKDYEVLNVGEAGATGNQAIISAGTGLGEAGLFWDGKEHIPFACEGGHSSFAPITELDAELFDYLHDKFGHVSWERVLSGTGLHNIYQFLRDTKRGEEPAWLAAKMAETDPAALISQAAADGASSRCHQAVEMLVTYYGAEASNLALKLMATGGVFIGGGIAPKMLSRLKQGSFLEDFFGNGRMRSLLQSMPVRVVLNPNTALLGAAHYAGFVSVRTSRN